MKDLISIEYLIDKSEKLCDHPRSNRKGLEMIRGIVVRQVNIVKKVNLDKIKNKIEDYNTNAEEYYKCAELYEEIKKYDEYSDKIDAIINRKYNYLNNNRKPVNKKLVGLVVAGSLVLGAGIFGACKYFKNSNNETPTTSQNTEYTVYEKVQEMNKSTESKKVENNIVTEAVKEDKKTEQVKEVPTEQAVTEQPVTEQPVVNESKYSEAEQETVVEVFKSMNDNMDDMQATGETKKSIKAKGKEFVVNIIDFVFYNASINGITYSDLEEKYQQRVYGYLGKIDKVIMTIDPDYKEELGDRYSAIKDFSKSACTKAKEMIIDKIGQERYDAIIAKKEEIIDKVTSAIKEYGGKALKYLRDKYQEWKED